MRSRPQTPLAACAAALLGAAVWAGACATAEYPAESHGDCVAGGCQQGSGSSSSSASSSGTCAPDAGCAVSWGTDIFSGIVDGPAGCTTMPCHGGGKGGITLTSGDSAGAYTALMGYTLLATPGPAKKYIVPCDPADSGFACNMAVAADAGANPAGACGFLMPFGAGETLLTQAQIKKIGDWIQCGAPEN